MQKLIDKLKFVEDELFKDENYYRGPVMGSIVDVRRELEQALQQTPVMRGGTPEPPPCSHLPMIDTGVGYLLCEACGYSQKIDGGGA